MAECPCCGGRVPLGAAWEAALSATRLYCRRCYKPFEATPQSLRHLARLEVVLLFGTPCVAYFFRDLHGLAAAAGCFVASLLAYPLLARHVLRFRPVHRFLLQLR